MVRGVREGGIRRGRRLRGWDGKSEQGDSNRDRVPCQSAPTPTPPMFRGGAISRLPSGSARVSHPRCVTRSRVLPKPCHALSRRGIGFVCKAVCLYANHKSLWKRISRDPVGFVSHTPKSAGFENRPTGSPASPARPVAPTPPGDPNKGLTRPSITLTRGRIGFVREN